MFAKKSSNVTSIVPASVVHIKVIAPAAVSKISVYYASDLHDHFTALAWRAFADRKYKNKVFTTDFKRIRRDYYFNGRMIPNRMVPLCEYGVRDGATINMEINVRHFGGSQMLTPPIRKIEPVVDIEDYDEVHLQRFIKTQVKRNKRFEERAFEIQSVPGDIIVAMRDALRLLKAVGDTPVTVVIEDVLIFALQLFKAKDAIDVALCTTTFIKLRTGKSITSTYAELMSSLITDCFGIAKLFEASFNYGIQSESVGETTENLLDSFRSYMNNFDSMKESELGRKYTILFKNLMSLGMLEWMGIKPTHHLIRGVKEVNINWVDYASLVHCVVDTASLTLLRAVQAARTGSFEAFIHGPKTYQDWFDKCLELKRLSNYAGNLEALGTDYFKYVADINTVITNGESICKFTLKENKAELRSARTMLNDMYMLKNDVLCVASAQQERRSPFALLIFGGSSVMKSAFQKAQFYYFGKLLGLPVDDCYKFPRNSKDERWDNFKSSMWCVTMDDIAYLDPTKATMDETLSELIQIINNVPLVPQQASLDDKGKTPVRAKLVLATTNTKDLNAFNYFACPLAVQRRLPWVITLEPKPEYARDDSPGMMDPLKVPEVHDEFPDFWKIKVERVVANGTAGKKQVASHKLVKEFDNIYDYFDWLGPVILEFERVQAKAMSGDAAMRELKFCRSHNRPTKICGCDLQAGVKILLPKEVKWGDSFWCRDEDCMREYAYSPANECYVCKTTYDDGRTFVAPVEVVEVVNESPDICSASEAKMYYSEIIDATIERRLKDERNWITTFGVRVTGFFVKTYVNHEWFRNSINKITQVNAFRWVIRSLVLNWFQPIGDDLSLMKFCSEFLSNDVFRSHRKVIKILASLVAIASGIFMVTKVVQHFSKVKITNAPLPAPKIEIEQEEVLQEDGSVKTELKTVKCVTDTPTVKKTITIHPSLNSDFDNIELPLQGSMLVKPEYFKKDDKVNVWKKEDYETTTFDVAPISYNYLNLSRDKLVSMMRRNVARVDIKHMGKQYLGHIFCVGGHLWVSNNHIFPVNGDLTVDIMFEKRSQGASRNMTILLEQSMMFRCPGEDLVWFEMLNIEPKRDFSTLICTETLRGTHRTVSVCTDANHQPVNILSFNVNCVKFECEKLKNNTEVWMGTASSATYNGYCGSPMLAVSPAVVILGLHQRYHNGTIVSTRLCQRDLEEARKHFVRPLIQSSAPLISAAGVEKTLSPLSHNAHVRFLTEGHINVYGSIPSTNVQPRSKVAPTFISKKIAEDREWTTDCTAPNLRDWRMWKHGITDVVNQKHLIKQSVLQKCVDAFASEVLSSLAETELSKMRILDDHSAINGVAGVRFLDSINMNTSMGYPWCHSKKIPHETPTYGEFTTS